MIFIKPKRGVKKVFIHCSASDIPAHDNVATIRQWHLERGFKDIGYHYYIDKSGTIHTGRDLEAIPASQEGHNLASIAICLGGLLKRKFTGLQYEALRTLCKEINAAYYGDITFHGHCEVNKGKDCPVFEYKKVLKLDAKGKLLT